MADISFRRVKISDITLHVAFAGPDDGKPLIFLHGFPDFWFGWRHQIEFFANLGYRVIAPDLRGYNKSDKPKGVNNYKISLLAQDILDLQRALGLKDSILIGHDWGGAIAWSIAANFSETFSQFIILNVPHPSVLLKAIKSNPHQIKKSWYIFFFQIPKLPQTIIGNRFAAKILQEIIKRGASAKAFNNETLKRYRKSWQMPGAAVSMINYYKAALRYSDPITKGSKITKPLLLLWGMKDIAFINDLAHESLEYCTEAKLELFEDNGHWVHCEIPEIVNKKIEEFIK